jgi:hypothetical protein
MRLKWSSICGWSKGECIGVGPDLRSFGDQVQEKILSQPHQVCLEFALFGLGVIVFNLGVDQFVAFATSRTEFQRALAIRVAPGAAQCGIQDQVLFLEARIQPFDWAAARCKQNENEGNKHLHITHFLSLLIRYSDIWGL